MNSLYSLAQKFESELLSLAKENQNYIYHLKPKGMQGKVLYSLSDLKEIHPEVYRKEIKKYKGREDHPEIKVPILDCQWKNCISFSTLNPIKIFRLQELLGIKGYLETEEIDILQFEISSLGENVKYCLYDDNISPKKSTAYSKTSEKSYKETQFVPALTVKYFAECQVKKEYPLLFGNVTHLLVTGSVDVSSAKILNFKLVE